MKKGYLYIAVATLMFSSFEVALKYIAGQINPVQLTLCRFAVGFVCLLPLALRTLKKRGKRLDGKALGRFALLGLTGIALSMPILHLSVNYTSSAVVAVLYSCNPVFVTFLAFFVLKEPIKKRHIAALTLEILGAVAIINPFETTLNLTGVFLALLSTLLFSVYGVLGKRKCEEYGGAVVTCFSFLFGSLIVLAFIGLSHLPTVAQFFLSIGAQDFANIPILAGYTLQNLPFVLYVSIGVAGVGFCTYFLALECQPASVVMLVYFFKPTLSPILTWLLHDEVITPPVLLGIVLIVCGSLCAIVPGLLDVRRTQKLARL